MAALFGSNPFSSQVGQKIEIATEPTRPTEDWTIILEICDIINETDEGPKDAVKAIRKRFSNHKYPKSILYTLTVIEACVKNCGPRFHKQIATKEFLNDMTKMLGQKRQPSNLPAVVQEKVLALIQSWSDAFRNAPELQQIKLCYDTLKQEGHEFPAQDMDNLSPIFTPNRLSDAPTSLQPPSQTAQPGEMTRTFAPPTDRPQTAPVTRQMHGPPHPSGPINPSPGQMEKIKSELDIVKGNVRVLSEMLSELQPGQENSDDYELLVELNKTCREMQKRLVALVDRIANEEVTGVLLRINDDLNNVFIRYDRYENNRKAVTGEVAPQAQQQQQPISPQRTLATGARTTGESSLIEFTDTSASVEPHQQDEEFDMFAQSRGTTFADSRVAGSTYADNIEGVPTESVASLMSSRSPYPKLPTPEPDNSKPIDEDIEDVEKWLQGTSIEELEAQEREAREAEALRNAPPPKGIQTSADAQTLSSSEFDKFLSERATVGSQRTSSDKQPARQMTNVAGERGESSTDQMFGL